MPGYILGVNIETVVFELEVAEHAQGMKEHKSAYKEEAGVTVGTSFSHCYSNAPRSDVSTETLCIVARIKSPPIIC